MTHLANCLKMVATFLAPVGILLSGADLGQNGTPISDLLHTASSARYTRWRHLKEEIENSVKTNPLHLHALTSLLCGT